MRARAGRPGRPLPLFRQRPGCRSRGQASSSSPFRRRGSRPPSRQTTGCRPRNWRCRPRGRPPTARRPLPHRCGARPASTWPLRPSPVRRAAGTAARRSTRPRPRGLRRSRFHRAISPRCPLPAARGSGAGWPGGLPGASIGRLLRSLNSSERALKSALARGRGQARSGYAAWVCGLCILLASACRRHGPPSLSKVQFTAPGGRHAAPRAEHPQKPKGEGSSMKLLNIALALIIFLQLLLALHQFRRHRKLKKHQQRLVEALGGSRFWRVGMARVEFLKSWPKLSPQQALGVLIDEGDSVRIKGRWYGAQEDFEQVVSKELATLTWLAPHPWRTANLAWVQVDAPAGPLLVCAETLANPRASREALADMVRSVFPGFALPTGAASDFSLEKNRYSLTAMVAFLALLLLAAGAVLVGVGLFSYRRLLTGQVPVQESLVLALFLTGALAMAALPALKRVDQVLANGPSTWYAYRLVDRVVHLSPVDARQGLPTLRFTKAPEYWAQMPVGSEVQVPLLRGPLGLWQLDHQRFDPPILAFYENASKK